MVVVVVAVAVLVAVVVALVVAVVTKAALEHKSHCLCQVAS